MIFKNKLLLRILDRFITRRDENIYVIKLFSTEENADK